MDSEILKGVEKVLRRHPKHSRRGMLNAIVWWRDYEIENRPHDRTDLKTIREIVSLISNDMH